MGWVLHPVAAHWRDLAAAAAAAAAAAESAMSLAFWRCWAR